MNRFGLPWGEDARALNQLPLTECAVPWGKPLLQVVARTVRVPWANRAATS